MFKPSAFKPRNVLAKAVLASLALLILVGLSSGSATSALGATVQDSQTDEAEELSQTLVKIVDIDSLGSATSGNEHRRCVGRRVFYQLGSNGLAAIGITTRSTSEVDVSIFPVEVGEALGRYHQACAFAAQFIVHGILGDQLPALDVAKVTNKMLSFHRCAVARLDLDVALTASQTMMAFESEEALQLFDEAVTKAEEQCGASGASPDPDGTPGLGL